MPPNEAPRTRQCLFAQLPTSSILGNPASGIPNSRKLGRPLEELLREGIERAKFEAERYEMVARDLHSEV
jgi:hypothetical protein